MKVLFTTLEHRVSDKEFARLAKAFVKVGVELSRQCDGYDVLMVRGWASTWEELRPLRQAPVVYYSVGTEWKNGEDLCALNSPVRGLYENADAFILISEFCRVSHQRLFGRIRNGLETVIIPACEPHLPSSYPTRGPGEKLRLATTCLPRPVKRVEELQRLAAKYNIEVVGAYGDMSDFSYYHECDGYVHLSRKEGMPNAVLEALSYGLPCIVTNYGGAKEAVADAGIIIRNDPEDVAWDPGRIEPVDDLLFEQAIEDFRRNLRQLRLKVRERVLTQLNDYVAAWKFREVFEGLLRTRRRQ